MNKKTFTIGTSTIPGDVIIPRMMPNLIKRSSDLALKFVVTDSRETYERVFRGEYEVGVIGTRYETDEIDYMPIIRGDRLVLIAPKDHPNADKGNLTWDELSRQPFITREPGSGTRASYEDALRQSGVDLNTLDVVAELSDTASVIAAVEAGAGVSIVSEVALQASTRCGNVAVLDLPIEIRRNFYNITNKTHPLSQQAQSVLDMLKEALSV